MINRYPANPELAAAMRALEAEGQIECFEGAHGEARWRLVVQPTERMDFANAQQSETPAVAATAGLSEFRVSTDHAPFDIDIPFGRIDLEYSPSDVLTDVLFEVAGLDDLGFRFWCAMTMAINLSSVAPCEDAEDVIVEVIGEAFAYDGPIDQSYRLALEASGRCVGVLNADGDQYPADAVEALCLAVVSLPTVDMRFAALIELSELCAITEANEALAEPIARHSLWRVEMRQADH